ncbi:DOPA 4,5-dioxygenase family protein [Pigmentibacter ruber]
MADNQQTNENTGGFVYLKDFLDPNFKIEEYLKNEEIDRKIRLKEEILNFHAHVYYTLESKETAKLLYQEIAERFRIQLGMMYDFAAGPHTYPQFEVAFTTNEFSNLIPWLMLNRMGLSILIHTNTVYPRDDHLKTCFWLGKQLPLKGEKLPEHLSVVGMKEPPQIHPNTVPTILSH